MKAIGTREKRFKTITTILSPSPDPPRVCFLHIAHSPLLCPACDLGTLFFLYLYLLPLPVFPDLFRLNRGASLVPLPDTHPPQNVGFGGGMQISLINTE